MPENTPTQPSSNPNTYDPVQASLQFLQQQLAEQGIDVTPEAALQLHVQQTAYDAKHWVQQDLAKQGINVSPKEATQLFWLKRTQDIKHGIQQRLAEQGIDVSPDEADAIHKLQFYHRLMQRIDITDPSDAT